MTLLPSSNILSFSRKDTGYSKVFRMLSCDLLSEHYGQDLKRRMFLITQYCCSLINQSNFLREHVLCSLLHGQPCTVSLVSLTLQIYILFFSLTQICQLLIPLPPTPSSLTTEGLGQYKSIPYPQEISWLRLCGPPVLLSSVSILIQALDLFTI